MKFSLKGEKYKVTNKGFIIGKNKKMPSELLKEIDSRNDWGIGIVKRYFTCKDLNLTFEIRHSYPRHGKNQIYLYNLEVTQNEN